MVEVVDVVVKVPADRVADLYAMVAQLNRPKPGASSSSKEVPPGDLQDLTRMFRDLAQDFFRHVA